MESNERYYRRRAIQELAAARRAVTPYAFSRRRGLAEVYLRRLAELTGIDETAMLEAMPAMPFGEAGLALAGVAALAPAHEEAEAARAWILE